MAGRGTWATAHPRPPFRCPAATGLLAWRRRRAPAEASALTLSPGVGLAWSYGPHLLGGVRYAAATRVVMGLMGSQAGSVCLPGAPICPRAGRSGVPAPLLGVHRGARHLPRRPDGRGGLRYLRRRSLVAMAVKEPGVSSLRVPPRLHGAAAAAQEAPESFATDIFWLQTLNVTKNYGEVRPCDFLPGRLRGLTAVQGRRALPTGCARIRNAEYQTNNI